jgi:FkbH-like protein
MVNETPARPAACATDGEVLSRGLLEEPAAAAHAAPVRVALLADCMAAFRLEVLKKVAASRGIALEGVAGTAAQADADVCRDADFVILFPWTYGALSPLWHPSALLDEAARAERLVALKEYLTVTIGAVASAAAGRLVLVQGLAAPPLFPQGRVDFRSKMSYRRILFEINEHVCDLIRESPNMLFVDEERIFSNRGKRQLLNHAPAIYTQYVSGLFDHGQNASRPLPGPLAALAMEYLDLYVMWSGRERIKCIVTDLDNTLWPGEIGEGGPQADALEIAMSSYGGLHEALKIMKGRGVLLATCSKNTPEHVFRAWAELASDVKAFGFEHFLEPDDFVMHRINWERKSDNIRDIQSALGFSAASILFIDDHPVEREEVGQAIPELTILDSHAAATRYELLGDPRLEVAALTKEARARTEMTRAQLRREEERREGGDQQSFLRSLRIKVRVTLERTETKLARIVELIQRTNQFNTTQTRHDTGAIRAFLSRPEAELYTMEVSDKFTDYGLTGVCMIEAGEVVTFVMSCRVLGLKVETSFLVSAVRFGRWAGDEVRGRIIETRVNQPCRQLFLRAGFTDEGGGRYALRQGHGLASIDPSVYDVTVTEEPPTTEEETPSACSSCPPRA